MLSDLRTHAVWGGVPPTKKSGLLSIEAPSGEATVGTEWTSTGGDPMGRFTDRSVVTQAVRPSVFEFVTEARLTTKKDATADWTNVHRYELRPEGDGCVIAYTVRIARISALPGMLRMFNLPVLSGMAVKESTKVVRRGVEKLAAFVEQRARRALTEGGVMPKTSKQEASETFEAEGFEGHYQELEGFTIGFESYSAEADLADLFKGLPDDACQCNHMGVVLSGKLVFTYTDGTQDVITAGEAYVTKRGHTPRSSRGPK